MKQVGRELGVRYVLEGSVRKAGVVRFGHWALVTAFAVAYFSGDEADALHVWSAYVVGGLVVLRVLWGFIGPASRSR